MTTFHLYLQVKWAKENYHHNIGSPYSLRLASADATGKIIVWDVATGTARCEIQEHAKPIQGNDNAQRKFLYGASCTSQSPMACKLCSVLTQNFTVSITSLSVRLLTSFVNVRTFVLCKCLPEKCCEI